MTGVRALHRVHGQRANSGHPGTPMALAPLIWLLFTRHLRHNPATPAWSDRDRFVLSAGHASMLLYSALYLSGYDLSLDDIKQFRQWDSRTPGHPEYGVTPGVEVTTGPLGQGVGNAVGFAIAEAHLGAVFDKGGHRPVDHHTWFIASDGDMMEGASHEAASLAGHLRLGGVHFVGASVGDVGPDHDERGPAGLRVGGADGGVQRVEVVPVGHVLHLPA
ncbi:MAG TPA: hypothetical protein VM365_07400, partial [Gemmatimonadales bacterium]|nr:hypothetical protein [Gemmatimonadales bacterium]